MKNLIISLGIIVLLVSCGKDIVKPDDMLKNSSEVPNMDYHFERSADSIGNESTFYKMPPSEAAELLKDPPGGRVGMQAFYWDCPPNWWNILANKIPEWAQNGIGLIWIPPMSKAAGGGFSMGYDVYDYFDLGEFNQKGSTETRFGSRGELERLVRKAHEGNISVVADIVLNHTDGGEWQDDPYLSSIGNPYAESKRQYRAQGDSAKTDYTQVASGRFPRDYRHYYPTNINVTTDPSSEPKWNDGDFYFGEFGQELALKRKDVQDSMWGADNSVAHFYKDEIGIDGWRFDFVKGFGAWVVDAWQKEVGGWGVVENWDGLYNISAWLDQVNNDKISAFDFPAFYMIKEAFDYNDLSKLSNSEVLFRKRSTQAVTFLDNHDIHREEDRRIENKSLAYAFILTSPGFPFLFYVDYEQNENLKEELNRLILARMLYATGDEYILRGDWGNQYIMARQGDDRTKGLILYLNISDEHQYFWTNHPGVSWANDTIYDVVGNSTREPVVYPDGRVEIDCPPHSYTVWAVQGSQKH